ncbi:uncharacterized protein LOC135105856 [Scylla paramamosain]|uniref:uncharacterized protein LOC135105856 n=1 Tax=Scylla paramamosain TaxID=85552 RepID=UPI0030839580
MFSARLHLRLVGLLVNSLSFMFIFWAIEDFGGDCAKLVVLIMLPLTEVLARFYHLCEVGQSVICARENLLAAVREAAYEAGLGTPSSEVLSELATRLSATPLAVKNWGMEK